MLQVLDRAPATPSRRTMAPQTARERSTVARRPLPGSEAHQRPETTAKKCVNPCARFSSVCQQIFRHKPPIALSHAGIWCAVGPVGRTDARRRAPRSAQGRGGPRPVRVLSVRGGCDIGGGGAPAQLDRRAVVEAVPGTEGAREHPPPTCWASTRLPLQFSTICATNWHLLT